VSVLLDAFLRDEVLTKYKMVLAASWMFKQSEVVTFELFNQLSSKIAKK
jgi:hypothetical protein